jgi:hypothetical protein
MRWTGSMVADMQRILTRGGFFVSWDARESDCAVNLRLMAYEAKPLGMILIRLATRPPTAIVICYRTVTFIKMLAVEARMVNFPGWCDSDIEAIGQHHFERLDSRQNDTAAATIAVAAAVPGHFVTGEHVARVLRRLGRSASATFLENKLPTKKSARSGDLGEILTTEYIRAKTPYIVPINRLRWKDHRTMAMRGDDVIGMVRDPRTKRLRFLKAEAKSYASLTQKVIDLAREGLDKDGGLPSAHALEFIADRLLERGDTDLCDAIDDALLPKGISPSSVSHLLFVCSGSNGATMLRASVGAYGGTMQQNYVRLRIPSHQAFIANVYQKVIDDARNG